MPPLPSRQQPGAALLAARMEQLADPGAIVITPDTLALVEGYEFLFTATLIRLVGSTGAPANPLAIL